MQTKFDLDAFEDGKEKAAFEAAYAADAESS